MRTWQSNFVGMVTEVTTTDKILKLTAYDSCYYLNKSKRIMQFDDTTVSAARLRLMERVRHFQSPLPRNDSTD